MKWISKIRMWIWLRSRMIEEMMRLNQLIDSDLAGLTKKIMELEQHKIYVVMLKGYSKDKVTLAIDAFRRVKDQMNWSMPKFLFMTENVREIEKKELIELKKHMKKQGVK